MFTVVPSQNRLFNTPVVKEGTKSDPTLTVKTLDDKLPQEMLSSKIPSESESIHVNASLLKLVVTVRFPGGA